MDGRAREVQLALVGRNLRTGLLEHVAIPNRPIPDTNPTK